MYYFIQHTLCTNIFHGVCSKSRVPLYVYILSISRSRYTTRTRTDYNAIANWKQIPPRDNGKWRERDKWDFRKTSNKYYRWALIIIICSVLGRVAIDSSRGELLIDVNKTPTDVRFRTRTVRRRIINKRAGLAITLKKQIRNCRGKWMGSGIEPATSVFVFFFFFFFFFFFCFLFSL